jgi:toxin FitB
MFLLDTNVISELRRLRPHGAVLAWLRSISDADLYLSAVTIGELQAGVEVTREQNLDKAMEIETWIEQIASAYNVLPMDARTFRCWAQFLHRRPSALAQDVMIAATAKVHNLTVATRNVRDFERFGVPTLNPFKAATN